MTSEAVPVSRTGNLLGALSIAISDRISKSLEKEAQRSTSTAAALSALLNFLDRPSIGLLSRVLGLTSSGTVRLLDRLEQERLVQRTSGSDGRTSAVVLTAAGRRVARKVVAARARVMEDALEALSAQERRTMDDLVGKIMTGLVRAPGAVRWMCRLCDLEACGRSSGFCPVANEARRRDAAPDL